MSDESETDSNLISKGENSNMLGAISRESGYSYNDIEIPDATTTKSLIQHSNVLILATALNNQNEGVKDKFY